MNIKFIKRPMCLICLVFTLIVFVVLKIKGGVDETDTFIRNGEELQFLDGEIVSLTGVIKQKTYKNNKHTIHIKNVKVKSINKSLHKINGDLILYLDAQDEKDFYIGQSIEVCGRYTDFDIAENDGQFNMRKFYRIRGYAGKVQKCIITKAGEKYNRYSEFLYKCRERVKRSFYENMSEIDAGIMCTIVVGDKSGLDQDVKELYQNAGISHVLSLSGLHVAVLGIGIFSLLTKLGIGSRISSVTASLVMFSYCVMTGMSTSTIRAFIMFVLGLIAKNLNRTYELLSAVSLSTMLILFENPYYIYDSGFLLSVSAVVGIGMIYPVLDKVTELKNEGKIINKVRQGMCVSMAATIATMPVVMNSFYKLPRLGILLNIIVVPLMSVLLGVGVIGGILGGKWILAPASIILKLYTYVSRAACGLGWNTWITGKADVWQIWVYIILYIALYLYWNHFKKNCRINGLHKCVIISYYMISMFILSYRIKPQFEINVLSVGQGACNVIYGKDTPVIMIDGGSTDVKDVYKYRIEPFLLSKGIDKIDYLFVSHPDEDHISGIRELLSESNGGVIVGNIFLGDVKELCKLASASEEINNGGGWMKSGIKVYELERDDCIKNKEVIIDCLGPEKEEKAQYMEAYDLYRDGTSEEKNDESLVLKITYKPVGFEALFTGDISSKVERDILDSKLSVCDLDFLTVAHHGSKYSSSAEFIEFVNPKIATISVGKGNSYGHPHKETLERFNKYAKATRVFRTDESGQITIVVGGNVKFKRFKERYYDGR